MSGTDIASIHLHNTDPGHLLRPDGQSFAIGASMLVPMVCPRCQADLRGQGNSLADRPLFDDKTHFSRVIGIYGHQADATVAWHCPDCGYEWARTEEEMLLFGLHTFELMSHLFVGPEPMARHQPPKSAGSARALAEQ